MSPVQHPSSIWGIWEGDTVISMSRQQWQWSVLCATGLQFGWAVHSFHGRHFASTIQSRNLPFHVQLACNPYESARSLFQEFTSCKRIFSSATNFLNHIRASKDTSVIHGFLIHSNHYQTSETTSNFWQLQTSIVSQLRQVQNLSSLLPWSIRIMTAKASRHLLQTWSPTVGLSPPQMSLTQTWAILLQVLVDSSLAFIHHAPLMLNPCCSNTPLQFPLVLSLDSYGNPLIGLSIQWIGLQ